MNILCFVFMLTKVLQLHREGWDTPKHTIAMGVQVCLGIIIHPLGCEDVLYISSSVIILDLINCKKNMRAIFHKGCPDEIYNLTSGVVTESEISQVMVSL